MRRLDRRDGFEDMFENMRKMFDQVQDFAGGGMPVDIKEEDGKVIVTADLPGVQKEDIDLKADSETLEIAAESSKEVKEENEKYLRQERSARRYMRTIQWPSPVEPDTVSAEYQDGVLRVEAEKSEEEGRNIEIE
jgi:HSP20 family protein